MPKKKQGERMVTCWDGMPKEKKQHYIYVARDRLKNNMNCKISFAFEKMEKMHRTDVRTEFSFYGIIIARAENRMHLFLKDYGIKLKKGEQKRHPIDPDKWEDVN